MTKTRTPIPENVSAEVMFRHDRTCCVCGERGLAVQIHHIDENPGNHAIDNLAVLCLQHHEETQVRGGFAKKLKAADVVRHRDDWVRRVSDRRDKADERVIQYMAGGASTPSNAEEEWNAPSEAKLIGFFDALPSIRKAAIAAAQRLWDTGITSEMRQGSYDAIEILERAWLQLAKFYPPAHFGSVTADHFFSEFIAGRFEWHRQIAEPRGPGSSGTIINITAGGAVLDDVADAIEETVDGLFIGYALLTAFDLNKWRREWKAAGERNDKENQSYETALEVTVGAGGAFEEKRSNGLYKTRHTFSVAIKNNDEERFLSNCKFFLDISDPKDGTSRTYLLVDAFTLNASEERYVPIVSYDEPATISRHAGDAISLHVPIGVGYDVGYGWPWHLPLGAYSLKLRATSKQTAPCEVTCKIWVDDESHLHLDKA